MQYNNLITMGTIYYILGFLFFIHEFFDVINPLNRVKATNKNKEISKRIKELNEIKDSDVLAKMEHEKLNKELLNRGCLPIFSFVWVITGLLSSQWEIFLLLLASLMLHGLAGKVSQNLYYRATNVSLFSLINLILTGYVILNHFHNLNLIVF